jgi:hypothetical protein
MRYSEMSFEILIAAQKLNEKASVTIFGIVSNGTVWQFGKLEANFFTKNIFH